MSREAAWKNRALQRRFSRVIGFSWLELSSLYCFVAYYLAYTSSHSERRYKLL